MSIVGAIILTAVIVVLTVLAPRFGSDSRPAVDDPPDLMFRHRS